MQIQFVGSGDAFGSGGRANTCFHVVGAGTKFLIDCGATSLVRLKQLNIDRNAIDFILATHFHADHFGGIPFFILDAQFAKRTKPLTIVGPQGLKEWLPRSLETAFPGSAGVSRKFELSLIEAGPDRDLSLHGVGIQAALVRHGKPEGAFHAYRIEVEGKVIAYTGDTEWTDQLIAIGRDADLLIAEAYFFEKNVPLHLSYATLMEKLPLIAPKRLILTHMNDDMLSRLGEIEHQAAADGLLVSL